MARLDEFEVRWHEETRAALAALQAWWHQHPAATPTQVAAALDDRLRELRARLLDGAASGAPGRAPAPHGAAVPTARADHDGAAVKGVEIQRGVEYAHHDGVALVGDLYLPAAPGTYPGLVLIHGGGWQSGTRATYAHWGPFLAERGYVAFSIDYRLSTPLASTYPQAVGDARAAVQFLRGRGSAVRVDADRIGVIGNSAGGHLAALIALAGDVPRFATLYPGDEYHHVSGRVRVAVPIYGVYDLVRQWEHDQLTRPRDQIVEKFLGGSPMEVRDVYYEASPISWATVQHNDVAFLVVWGTDDDIVEPESQALPFVTALKRADIFTRTVPVPGAPHFWIGETPVLEPGSFTAYLAPRLLRFLAQHL